EQAVEMRSRQPGFPSNRIELELGTRTLRHQLDRFADTKVGDRYGRCPRFLRGPSGLPAFLVAAVDQLPQFAVETTQRGGTADQSCRASDVLVQGGGSREAGSAEPKAMCPCGVGGEPFRVDIKHEEDCAIAHVGGNEIMRLPRVDRDDGILGEQPSVVADIDPRRRTTDVKDQVPLAMRMHVERTVQLIDRRATKPTVEDGERSTHAITHDDVLLNKRSSSRERLQEPETDQTRTIMSRSARTRA